MSATKRHWHWDDFVPPVVLVAAMVAIVVVASRDSEAHPAPRPWQAERRCNDRAVISRDWPVGANVAELRRFVCVYGRWVEFFDIPNPGCCLEEESTP